MHNRFLYAGLVLLSVTTTIFAPPAVLAQNQDPPTTTAPVVDIVAIQPLADLVVHQLDAPDPAKVGGFVTYRVAVTNNGPNTSTGVHLMDLIPSTGVFVSASAGCVVNPSSTLVTCQLGDLVSGDTAWRSITVRPSYVGVMSNYARATSPVTFDPNLNNNASVEPTTVAP